MTNTPSLLPCPFCGAPGHEKLYVQHVLETGGVGDVDELRTFIDKQMAANGGNK